MVGCTHFRHFVLQPTGPSSLTEGGLEAHVSQVYGPLISLIPIEIDLVGVISVRAMVFNLCVVAVSLMDHTSHRET